jgi:hypothetical protein
MEIPAWLESSLKPLLSGSAGRLNEFAGQGYNILQGLPAGGSNLAGGNPSQPIPGLSPEFWKDPRVMQMLSKGAGGAGRGGGQGGSQR